MKYNLMPSVSLSFLAILGMFFACCRQEISFKELQKLDGIKTASKNFKVNGKMDNPAANGWPGVKTDTRKISKPIIF